MAKNAQRMSQLVGTFGAGAMIDLPTRSTVVAGLDYWYTGVGKVDMVSEPRLIAKLEDFLRKNGRLEEGKRLSLRNPPTPTEGHRFDTKNGVVAPVFPKFFVCEKSESVGTETSTVNRRRVVHWRDLDTTKRQNFTDDSGTKSEVTPIRFVCGCKHGHLQDIEWKWVIHGADRCEEPMWIEERGTSADPTDTNLVCGCGKSLSLSDAFQPNRLGRCKGERPWLLDVDPNGCGEELKLLIRTATNTYFPQIYKAISLPVESDELTSIVAELLSKLSNIETLENLKAYRQFDAWLGAALGDFPDEAVFSRLQALRQKPPGGTALSLKPPEFDLLASGNLEIGSPDRDSKLYAQTLPRTDWELVANRTLSSAIKTVVVVHRLREVSCQYGFTRFEAAPTGVDGDLEDVSIDPRDAPLTKNEDWLPAIELRGEGIFIRFDEEKIAEWLSGDPAKTRVEMLYKGFDKWIKKRPQSSEQFPGLPYILLHSISHALISELSIECGYPASSIKERIYSIENSATGALTGAGILIYTATVGAQGTLGGLSATARRIAQILENALERLAICSNDPICADHNPDGNSGDRSTHGAACHSCLLIAETSCERRNLFLDRALLSQTMAQQRVGFFLE